MSDEEKKEDGSTENSVRKTIKIVPISTHKLILITHSSPFNLQSNFGCVSVIASIIHKLLERCSLEPDAHIAVFDTSNFIHHQYIYDSISTIIKFSECDLTQNSSDEFLSKLHFVRYDVPEDTADRDIIKMLRSCLFKNPHVKYVLIVGFFERIRSLFLVKEYSKSMYAHLYNRSCFKEVVLSTHTCLIAVTEDILINQSKYRHFIKNFDFHIQLDHGDVDIKLD